MSYAQSKARVLERGVGGEWDEHQCATILQAITGLPDIIDGDGESDHTRSEPEVDELILGVVEQLTDQGAL